MDASLAIFGMFGIFILLLILCICLVFYILRSLAYYTMAKERGIGHAWIAWIPVAQNWLIADLIGGKNAKIWGIGFVNWILTFGGVLCLIPYIGSLLSIAYLVYYWFCVNRVFQIYSRKQSTLFTVLSVLFTNADAIILFFIRKNPAVLPEEPAEFMMVESIG